LSDPVKTYVHTEKMRLIGRMHGRGWYARTTDLFLMDRLAWDADNQCAGNPDSIDRFS